MYVAKETGRSRYEVYDDTMRRRVIRRLQLTNALRRALDNDELELVWHPILPLDPPPAGARPVVTLEALLRWNHPDRGQIGPERFLEIAEDTGLMGPIGDWVVDAAGRQLREWCGAGGEGGGDGCPDYISVNLSASQLERPSIVPHVAAALGADGLRPSQVVLEITETALMARPERSIQRLTELRELGFVLSIDDFGTGYSSMSYLRDLPVQGLKVDRSFVGRIGESESDDAIVEAIVHLAHAVGVLAVAEGVETVEQLELLRRIGCDRAQGFLWTRPLPAAEVPGWIAHHRRNPHAAWEHTTSPSSSTTR
jgi:EAL domain-containing protein (putative c-di-GMP-specific phosphodiesterase class I)